LTVAALIHFRDAEVDLAVLEVGLGGRLDATNVTEPLLSVVTSIGLDHQKVLGDSLAEIAVEKAGIFRRGVPALSWVREGEALGALVRRAAELSTPLVDVRDSCAFGSAADEAGSGEELRLETESDAYRLHLPLAGRHQRDNTALAVRAAEALRELGFGRIGRLAVERGVAACRWAGRLEDVELEGGKTVVLDGAHNQQAAVALRSHFECSNDHPAAQEGLGLVFGALRDKSAASMLRTIASAAEPVLLTAPRSPRALSPEELATFLDGRRVSIASTSETALDRGLDWDVDRILVCGSIYLVGEIHRELRRRFGRPVAAAELRTGL